MFTRTIYRSVATLATTAAAVVSLGFGLAPAANAANAGACTVTNGAVTITGGGGIQLLTAHNDTFKFVGLQITCQSSDPTVNGAWNIDASGHSDAETCAAGTGGGTIDGGSHNGVSVDAGTTYSFTRAGTNVTVDGEIDWNGRQFKFHAGFEFTPNNGECSGDTSQPTTDATLTGAAAVTEGV